MLIDKLWQRGCEFLGVRYALMAGAMSWISEHHLVAAVSNAGGFGVLAGGSMPAELLAKEIDAVRSLTKENFGVNIVTMHPKIEEVLKVCIDKKVSHVILAGGIPNVAWVKMLKEAGIKVICFAPALILAKKMIRAGADALIIEGSEAGGHIGPVATNVLVQEILPHVTNVPVFVAGGIGSGDMIAAFVAMGASGCQLGTRFVCATESIAHENYKKAFISANSRDAIQTVQLDARFPVIPVRALSNEGTNRFMAFQLEMIEKFQRGEIELKDAQMQIEHFWVGALRRAVIDGDVENGSVMAGQSVGLVKDEKPAAEIIQELVGQAEATLQQWQKVSA